MGRLNLPSAGWVYLDTDAIIYSIEKISPYWQLLLPMWQAVQSEQFTIVSSELTLLETLIKPTQTGDKILENS